MEARSKQNVSSVLAGTKALPISEFNFNKASRNLILFLDTTNDDSNESVPVFKELTAAQKLNPSLFQAIAIFPNDRNIVENALDNWNWSVEHRSNFSTSEYQMEAMPTVLVTDQEGRILRHWSGELSSAQGMDIMKTLGVQIRDDPIQPSSAKTTLQIYDDSKPIQTIELPSLLEHNEYIGAKYSDPAYKSIDLFDVNGEGNIFLIIKNTL